MPFFGWLGLGGSYLPKPALDRLRTYVYHGTDKSLLYRYVWRPLCAWLVTYLPVWLSANLITVTALVLVSATHVLLASLIPDFSVGDNLDAPPMESHRSGGWLGVEHPPIPMPSFVFNLAALTLLMYVILDNLDGNQARRTHTASPLGLILDHGCDALNCVVTSLSVAAVASTGPTWKTWAFMLSIVVPFFMNTWEEYYIGELVLPVINGANEGVMIGIGIFLFTALMGGPQWWDVNCVTLPRLWLPDILAQPPLLAAMAIENRVLQAVCPWISSHLTDDTSIPVSSAIPMLLGLNCSDAHVSTQPLYPIDATKGTTGGSHVKHSVVHDIVLSLYDQKMASDVQLRYNTVGVILFGFCSVITIFGNVIRVYRVVHQRSNETKFGSRWLARHLAFLRALTCLLPPLTLTLFATCWSVVSPGRIFQKHPRIFCWTFGLLYTKCAIHLMIAHICNTEIYLLRRTMFFFLLCGACLGFEYFRNILHWPWDHRKRHTLHWVSSPSDNTWSAVFDEEHVLLFLFVLSVVSFVHMVVVVVLETAAALDVPLFTVPRSKQEFLLKQIREMKAKKTK